MPSQRRALVLLGGGALAGLVLATVQLVWRPEGAALETNGDAVALVNGVPISRADFEQAVSAVASDRRDGLQAGDAERVLERLVDEELLLQRALALGLVRREPRVRGQLVRLVIDAATAGAGAHEPTDGELRAFHDAHPEYFTRPGRLRVIHRAVVGTDGAARERAVALVEALRSRRVPEARTEVVTAPDALLPMATLERYLGPSVLAAAGALAVGVVSQPIAAGGGYHVVQVVEREADAAPPYAEVREAVRSEVLRRRGEEALGAYLEELRRDAEVRMGEAVP